MPKEIRIASSEVVGEDQISRHQQLRLATEQKLTRVGMDNPEQYVLVNEAFQVLYASISLLPPRDQRVLYLLYYKGMTLKAAGVELGVTGSRVQQLRKRSLRKLRQNGDLREAFGYKKWHEGPFSTPDVNVDIEKVYAEMGYRREEVHDNVVEPIPEIETSSVVEIINKEKSPLFLGKLWLGIVYYWELFKQKTEKL